MKAILETRDLVKYYGKGDNLVKAIDHTDLIIEPGEFTAIVGRSGSGKSTLLHMLGGLDRPDSGKVLIEGRDIFKLKDESIDDALHLPDGTSHDILCLLPVSSVSHIPWNSSQNTFSFGNIGSFCGHWKSCRIWCISLCKNQTHVSDQ